MFVRVLCAPVCVRVWCGACAPCGVCVWCVCGVCPYCAGLPHVLPCGVCGLESPHYNTGGRIVKESILKLDRISEIWPGTITINGAPIRVYVNLPLCARPHIRAIPTRPPAYPGANIALPAIGNPAFDVSPVSPACSHHIYGACVLLWCSAPHHTPHIAAHTHTIYDVNKRAIRAP